MRVLHHKQILPANVHSYSPGINRVTDRLLKTLESSRNEDGYVEDIYPHLLNWTMEGAWLRIPTCIMFAYEHTSGLELAYWCPNSEIKWLCIL